LVHAANDGPLRSAVGSRRTRANRINRSRSRLYVYSDFGIRRRRYRYRDKVRAVKGTRPPRDFHNSAITAPARNSASDFERDVTFIFYDARTPVVIYVRGPVTTTITIVARFYRRSTYPGRLAGARFGSRPTDGGEWESAYAKAIRRKAAGPFTAVSEQVRT